MRDYPLSCYTNSGNPDKLFAFGFGFIAKKFGDEKTVP